METGSRHTGLILRQWSLSLSFVLFMSLSASLHPAALPLCLAFTASSHSFCFLPWFSFIHITLTSPPRPPPFPAFHSVQRFYLSLILFTSTLSRCLTSLASLLPSPTCLSHHLPHLFLFIHLALLVLHHLWFPLSPSPLFGHVFFPLL